MSKAITKLFVCILLLATGFAGGAFAQTPTPLAPGSIQVSRVQYDGNTVNDGMNNTFPYVFNDPNVPGIQGSIWIDQFSSVPAAASAGTLPLPATGQSYITTSFSSKSEGALMLAASGNYLTYMGYQGGDEVVGVSNSYSDYCPAQLNPNTPPNYEREVALIAGDGTFSLFPEENAFSGDNPRASITADGNEFYMAGNSDSTEYTATVSKPVCGQTSGTFGPGTTIGVRYDGLLNTETPPDLSLQLGIYVAADRTDESAKQHVKDNNWRGIGIYPDADGTDQDLFVSKGSGGNGDDGVFWVQNGTGPGLPTGTSNTIVPIFSAPATDPSGNASPYTPFGFWFANPTTLYVADEGYANLDVNGNLIADPLAGLEKWSLVNGSWTLLYTIQNGLNLDQPQTINNYPVPTYPTGIRNMTGSVNGDGSVTIYAITSQYSTISGGEPDPTSLVGITDSLAATTLPASEQFVTIQNSGNQQAYRGVAFIPPAPGAERQTQTITFPAVGTQTYGVGPITLSASATSGWPIVFSATGPATLLGNVLTITGAGTVTVSASQSGNTDYAPAVVSQTVIVNKAPQTLSFTVPAPATAIFGTSFTVGASTSSGLTPVYANGGSCTNVAGLYTMSSGVGECNVRVSQPGDSNYQAANPIASITLAELATPSVSLTGVPANAIYGNTYTLIATTNSSAAAVITGTNATACSLSGSSSPATLTIVKGGGGSCIFTAKWAADNDYAAASLKVSTVATKATSTITWPTPDPITYGTALSGTQLNAGANVEGTFTYTPLLGAYENAGNDTLKASFKPTNTNYSPATATVVLSVAQTATTTTITSPSAIVKLNSVGVASATLHFNVTSYKPLGAVTLTASTGEVCSGTPSALTGNGTCKLTFTTLGTRTVIAGYTGDANHMASDSSSQEPPITVTVNPH